MPVAEILSSIPITESLLKLVISKAKKVKDFKPLFKELVSTMERLVPIVQEIHMLQERLDPGNKELNFLTELLLSAKKMVHKCSQVRVYDAVKKISYAKKIKGINEKLLKFCQLDLSLIQHRNMLRSLSLKMEESSPPRLEHNSNVSSIDENEQQVILASFKDKGKGKQVYHDQEDEQVAAAIQESLNMQDLRQKTIVSRRKQEQQVILESCKDKVKAKKLHEEYGQVAAAIEKSLNMEKLLMRQAIQESIYLDMEQVATRHAKEIEKNEQIAIALQYDESERITDGSSSSTSAPLDEDDVLQRILWESLKNKGNRKAT